MTTLTIILTTYFRIDNYMNVMLK